MEELTRRQQYRRVLKALKQYEPHALVWGTRERKGRGCCALGAYAKLTYRDAHDPCEELDGVRVTISRVNDADYDESRADRYARVVQWLETQVKCEEGTR